MKRNAVIIAAGTASRFVPLSWECPKGLLMVRGEVLLERQIRQLKEADVDDIVIVCGYMAERFEYLKSKYDVKLIYNPDYYRFNNISSIVCALDYLENTFICCSDHYFTSNVFIEKSQQSYYAALYSEERTNEYCLNLNDDDSINGVDIGGEKQWYMAGHAFFNAEFSRAYKNLVRETYSTIDFEREYWEDIYIKHIHLLPKLFVMRYNSGDILEFDSLEELRKFDSSYILNTHSEILKQICNSLNCSESEINKIKKINEEHSFEFCISDKKYAYINGDIKLC